MRPILLALGLGALSCSSSPAQPADAGSPLEASDEARPPELDGGPDASPEASMEAGGASTSDAPADDGGPVDAPRGDAIPIGSDGATCTGNDPGDGGTWCTLYAFQVDGAPLDEAGNPHGISVTMACTPGQACTACVGGYGYAGLCE